MSMIDINGRLVRIVHSGFLEAGDYEFSIDGAGLSSGVYFFRLAACGNSQIHKGVLLR